MTIATSVPALGGGGDGARANGGSAADVATCNDGDDEGGDDGVRAARDDCPRRVGTAPSRAWFDCLFDLRSQQGSERMFPHWGGPTRVANVYVCVCLSSRVAPKIAGSGQTPRLVNDDRAGPSEHAYLTPGGKFWGITSLPGGMRVIQKGTRLTGTTDEGNPYQLDSTSLLSPNSFGSQRQPIPLIIPKEVDFGVR